MGSNIYDKYHILYDHDTHCIMLTNNDIEETFYVCLMVIQDTCFYYGGLRHKVVIGSHKLRFHVTMIIWIQALLLVPLILIGLAVWLTSTCVKQLHFQILVDRGNDKCYWLSYSWFAKFASICLHEVVTTLSSSSLVNTMLSTFHICHVPHSWMVITSHWYHR